MTKQDLIELDDAEVMDLGVASELTEGPFGGSNELSNRSSEPE